MRKENWSRFLLILLIFSTLACALFTVPDAIQPPAAATQPPKPTVTPVPVRPDNSSALIKSAAGGKIELEGVRLIIPPGALSQDTQVSIQRVSKSGSPKAQPELQAVGDQFKINIDASHIKSPISLEMAFDPARLPEGAEAGQVFLSYYDETSGQWNFAGGSVDAGRSVVSLPIRHASFWQPATWNWRAWIGMLSNTLPGNLADIFGATKLLVEGCPQTGKNVQLDASKANNVIQGCIDKDDPSHPELRIVNPKSFFFETRAVSGGNGYPPAKMLAPGEDESFTASTSDPTPLVIYAEITQKAGMYLVVHMVITMLPGLNELGFQSQTLACITERLSDVSYFASAVEALVVSRNAASAAVSINGFLKDPDAVRRFITTADDCGYGPARTWSIPGLKQLGGSISTTMSATDYIANTLARNSPAVLSFSWAAVPQLSKVQIGFFTNKFLNFDPAIWDAVPGPENGTQQNQEGESIYNLKLKANQECVLKDNLGFGTPDTWQYNQVDKTIGHLLYQVEKWTDSKTGQPVLMVYQYPLGNEPGIQRIELRLNGDEQACIQAAESVLAQSEEFRK